MILDLRAMIDAWNHIPVRVIVWSFAALGIAVAGGGHCRVVSAEERTTTRRPPFVSGFERFSRQGVESDSVAGALLISELSCAACHPTKDPELAAKGGVDLSSTGIRLQGPWMPRYLSDPAAIKPGTTMPHMLSGLADGDRQEAAQALAAFLTTQRKSFPTIKATGAMPVVHEFWNRGDPQRGSELYHTVGCIACHEPDQEVGISAAKPSAIDQLISQLDPDEIAELGLDGAARPVESVPHGDLAGKYTQRSLTMFLLDPTLTRPNARMPSLRLSPSEAADVAAHLLKGSVEGHASAASMDLPLVERGRSLFVQLRCANCHQTSQPLAPSVSKPLDQLDAAAKSSCLTDPSSGMPQYELDSDQVAAIKLRLGRPSPERSESSGQAVANDAVHLRMMQLNCYACHQRDWKASARFAPGGIGRFRKPYFETVGQVDLGDEGRLPPDLTGVGRKLVPKALAAALTSSKASRRGFMTIRMPVYQHDAVETLIENLPSADQVDARGATQVFADLADLADEGRHLVGTGCVECHPFRGESLPGVVGVDLADITQMVHPNWFYEFVLNPGAVKPRTRMPTFFPDGRSNQPDLLDGEPRRQIAAIWAYLSDLDQQPLPEKIALARSANYELVPQDRPILLRTFMNGAGTHAIAVGFPAGVHYAFDSHRVRLALGWKGRFLDARGTWFERFTPPAEPLGDSLMTFPTEVTFATAGEGSLPRVTALEDRDACRFGGYKLDANGVPTLLYGIGQWQIEDQIQASAEQGLRRTFAIREANSNSSRPGQQRVLWFLAHAAGELSSDGPTSMVDREGLTVSMAAEVIDTGRLIPAGGLTQWWFPVSHSGQPGDGQKSWVVEYRW